MSYRKTDFLKRTKGRIIIGSSYLICANVLVGITGILAVSLMARNLTINEFGLLAIIQAYTLTIGALISFQTWQTVIKYVPLVKNDNKLCSSLIKYSLKLDIATATIATVIGFLVIPHVANTISLGTDNLKLVYIYLPSILFNINGTATGYLRCADKYKYFLYADVVSSSIKLLIIFLISFISPNIYNYLIALLFVAFIQGFVLNLLLIKTLNENNISKLWKTNTREIKEKFPDIFSFSIYTNLISSFDLVFKQADTLVVSSFFGEEAAGIFKMVKTISGIFSAITDPVYITIYPIVSELVAAFNIKKLKQFAYNITFFLGILGIIGYLLFLQIDTFLISMFFSNQYVGYENYLDLYILMIILATIFMVIHPVANLIGLYKQTLYIIIVNSVLYITAIYMFKGTFGYGVIYYALILHTMSIILFKIILIKYKLLKVKS